MCPLLSWAMAVIVLLDKVFEVIRSEDVCAKDQMQDTTASAEIRSLFIMRFLISYESYIKMRLEDAN